MRITGGEFSGRTLVVPKGPRVRQTQDQVRKNLFNILAQQLVGTRVLDLFSGSGSLGLEAASRGAKHVTFVERSRFCIQSIRENLKNLGWTRFELIQSDVLQAIRRLASKEGAPFDFVFLDPPYGGDLARKSLNALGQYAIVASSGFVIVEHDKRDPLAAEVLGQESRLILQRQERYGDTTLTIYQRQ